MVELGHRQPETPQRPFKQLAPVGARTDAQGYGHIAAVYRKGIRSLAHCHLPQRLRDMTNAAEGESTIFIFELCAAVLMVFLANERGDTTPRTCALCVDNQAAATALIKGSTSSDLAGVLVNLFWNVAARGNARRRGSTSIRNPTYPTTHRDSVMSRSTRLATRTAARPRSSFRQPLRRGESSVGKRHSSKSKLNRLDKRLRNFCFDCTTKNLGY